jgi:CRP/FNR family transcriptional regulator, cyclic AMP receptor protein
MIEVTAAALAAHPMLHGMSIDHLAMLAGSASDVAFPAGHRLFEEGGNASHFWLLQSGSVALDLHVPGQGRVRIDTVGLGELLGWSWRFPPYRWAFGAVERGTRAYGPR